MRLQNLRFRVYGWLYIVLMDLVLVQYIHTFEGYGRGHDLKFFVHTEQALTVIYSPPTLNLPPTPVMVHIQHGCEHIVLLFVLTLQTVNQKL